MHKKILNDGARIFNGLPEWALMNDDDDDFEKILKQWDCTETATNDVYDKIVKHWECPESAVFGFVRECQDLLPHETNIFYIIPLSIISLCLQYVTIGW